MLVAKNFVDTFFDYELGTTGVFNNLEDVRPNSGTPVIYNHYTVRTGIYLLLDTEEKIKFFNSLLEDAYEEHVDFEDAPIAIIVGDGDYDIIHDVRDAWEWEYAPKTKKGAINLLKKCVQEDESNEGFVDEEDIDDHIKFEDPFFFLDERSSVEKKAMELFPEILPYIERD